MSFILITEGISIRMKLWMRFTNLGDLLCMRAAHVKIRISLVNQKTCISGAIPGDAKEYQRTIVRSISRAIAMQASEFLSSRLSSCSRLQARMTCKAIDSV
jgi:hypothetical protein